MDWMSANVCAIIPDVIIKVSSFKQINSIQYCTPLRLVCKLASNYNIANRQIGIQNKKNVIKHWLDEIHVIE